MDKKAFKIIETYAKQYLDYLTDSDWDEEFVPDIPPEEIAYAEQAGYYFDPRSYTHDELVSGVRDVVSRIPIQDAAKAFVASLGTRELAYRSALGSYVCALHMPSHVFTDPHFHSVCGICGITENESIVEHLTSFNYYRHRHGGYNHLDVAYQLFDLTVFRNMPPLEPSAEDYRIFRDIVSTIQNMHDDAKPRDVVKKLKGFFPSDSGEREKLVEILGFCGILETEEQKGFLHEYVQEDAISYPHHKTDWAYPVSWWKGKHGVNLANLRQIFGPIL